MFIILGIPAFVWLNFPNNSKEKIYCHHEKNQENSPAAEGKPEEKGLMAEISGKLYL